MFRKSNKQRRAEIKVARLKRKESTEPKIDVYSHIMPEHAVAADHTKLDHNNPFAKLPNFYIDRPFKCRDCGSDQVWTAEQQKWWYEIAKGEIDSIAVRCRPCRTLERTRKLEAKKVHLDGIAKKQRDET